MEGGPAFLFFGLLSRFTLFLLVLPIEEEDCETGNKTGESNKMKEMKMEMMKIEIMNIEIMRIETMKIQLKTCNFQLFAYFSLHHRFSCHHSFLNL